MKTVLAIRVVPNARKTAFEGVMDDGETLRIRLQAPPVDGKANTVLRQWLAKQLGISRNAIELLTGEKSREKRISISQLSRSEILAKLIAETR